MKQTFPERFTEFFNELDRAEQVSIFNRYTEDVNCPDDYIFSMYSFDEMMAGFSPLEIASKVQGDDFDISDAYFKFTIYGVESTSNVEEWIDGYVVSDLAEWAERNGAEVLDVCSDASVLYEEEEDEDEEDC